MKNINVRFSEWLHDIYYYLLIEIHSFITNVQHEGMKVRILSLHQNINLTLIPCMFTDEKFLFMLQMGVAHTVHVLR